MSRLTSTAALIGLMLVLVVPSAISREYRSEKVRLAELTQGVLAEEAILLRARTYVADRVARAENRLSQKPSYIIQREILNLYKGCRLGKPRLVFDTDGPGSWWVPMERDGAIGSFLRFGPYRGEIATLPMWKPGGEPMLSIEPGDWNNLEEIVTEKTGIEITAEARLVMIHQGHSFTLYIATPSDGQVDRVDVTSLGEPSGLIPGVLSDAPTSWAARSCVGEEEWPAAQEPEEGPSPLQPNYFELAVLPIVKNQGSIGACVGFSLSTEMDWWHCGNMCYMGTGNSELYSCLCPKGAEGECECMTPIISAQYCYDRTRYQIGSDCFDNPGFCGSRGCPDNPCQNRVVTDGAQCGNDGCLSTMRCAGSQTSAGAWLFRWVGACTWECQPFGPYAGCSDGGRQNCLGDCPNVEGPCGDDFTASNYGVASGIAGFKDALYHHGMLYTGGQICPCWNTDDGCPCAPTCPCPQIGGHAYVLVGYDEDLDLFYLQNSWGSGWGEGGRGEISYGFVNRFLSGAYWFAGTPPSAPKLTYADTCEVDDSAGNNDQRPDPGETVNLTVYLWNVGADATGVWARLSSDDPLYINITTDSTSFGSIPHNQHGDNSAEPFVFSVDPTSPCHDVNFYLQIHADGGYSTSDTLEPIRIGRPDILLVDDDAGGAYETWYESSLDSVAGLFDEWSVASQGATGAELLIYPCVIWFTGDDSTSTLSAQDETDLSTFLDAGSMLFITGQNIGKDIGSDPFYANYLHASFVSSNFPGQIFDGVPGDEIGDGLHLLTMGWPGAGNQTSKDIITPSADADSVLAYAPGEIAAIKYAGTYKVVYFAFGFEGIASRPAQGFTHADTVMWRVLHWLDPSLVGVEEAPVSNDQLPMTKSRLCQNIPNPFGAGGTVISFNVKRSTLNVSLRVYDLSGRLVRTLVDEEEEPGLHTVVWDGRDNLGRQVANGMYFYRLQARDFTATRSMVVLR